MIIDRTTITLNEAWTETTCLIVYQSLKNKMIANTIKEPGWFQRE